MNQRTFSEEFGMASMIPKGDSRNDPEDVSFLTGMAIAQANIDVIGCDFVPRKRIDLERFEVGIIEKKTGENIGNALVTLKETRRQILDEDDPTHEVQWIDTSVVMDDDVANNVIRSCKVGM